MTIVLPFIPPSLNRVAGRGPYNYRQAKAEITEQVRLLCLNQRPKKPINKADVIIRYYFPDRRRRYPDNYSGKFLLDGLTKAGDRQHTGGNRQRVGRECNHSAELGERICVVRNAGPVERTAGPKD